jgi:predicted ester cyclase
MAFSNTHVEIHDTIEQCDKVVARWTTTMTHAAAFLDVPPTGKHLSVNGISIQRFASGKIVEDWDNWDQLGLLVQLGAVPQAKFL